LSPQPAGEGVAEGLHNMQPGLGQPSPAHRKPKIAQRLTPARHAYMMLTSHASNHGAKYSRGNRSQAAVVGSAIFLQLPQSGTTMMLTPSSVPWLRSSRWTKRCGGDPPLSRYLRLQPADARAAEAARTAGVGR
jgi:hypothetical protein